MPTPVAFPMFRGLYPPKIRRGTLRLSLVMVALLLPAGLCPSQLRAQTAEAGAGTPALDPALGISTMPLWPGGAPGAKGTAPEDVPTLTVFRPERPNGTAIIVDPGGAYIMLAANHEGRQPADWLSSLGVTTFVLKYRLGPRYLYPVPLQDARRAVRLVRSLAPQFGYAPDRIGMLGFSAGGHLAATTGLLPEQGRPDAADPVERQSSQLNFVVLIYPWLNAMQPQMPMQGQPGKLMINYCSVTKGLTQADCAKLNQHYTPETLVKAGSPPAFLAQTADDNVVPIQASVGFFDAMHAAGADAELHVLAHGPHGFGMGNGNPVLGEWPTLLEAWLRARGWLTPPPQPLPAQ